MNWSQKKLCFAAFLIASLAVDGVAGDTVVTGTVFCDQCKDGQISLFDFPLPGREVTVYCPVNGGNATAIGTDTTNLLGGFGVRIAGTPDLRGCTAQISGGRSGSSSCVAGAGPARNLRLMFDVFGIAMYLVEPLISQPEFPKPFCPKSPPSSAPPTAQLPPQSAPPPPPPLPFSSASACSHQQWMMPEHRCHWRPIRPDAKVGYVFGILAAERYGADLTLWKGMQGRGEPYKTLLREATTALLNSHNSAQFPYQPLAVVAHMNYALIGNQKKVLQTALKFMKANSGNNGRLSCKFPRCNA